MSKEEFLDELRITLQGEVPQNIISENIEYYNRYIMGEMRKGRTIESIMEELGSPRLIGRTIIDTQANIGTTNSASYSQNEYNEDFGQDDNKGGFGEQYEGNRGWDIRFGKSKINTWYGKLLFILSVICILIVFGFILNLLFPIILFGIFIWFVISLFNRRY